MLIVGVDVDVCVCVCVCLVLTSSRVRNFSLFTWKPSLPCEVEFSPSAKGICSSLPL
jgi:hypothetical protein